MMKNVKEKDAYAFSRLLYIIEAALEYFVAIAVGTVYLAKITQYIGFSDSLTGIVSAFVSLGCGFQLIAIFLVNKRPVKRWVTVGHIVSQILFSCVYFVPLMPMATATKTVLFILVLLFAQLLHNVVNSPKITWYMSLVDADKRGRFTAKKQIISLLGGVAFSYALGATMDYFEATGNMRTAFLIGGIGVFALMLLHSATLIFAIEKEEPEKNPKESTLVSVKNLLKNKNFFKIVLIPVLWNIANYTTISFTGTYQTKELAFSTTFASVVIMVGSLMRAAFERPIGKIADKYSFVTMLTLCFSLIGFGFAVNIFTVPANGKVFYFVYYLLYSVGMAGISNATVNLVYDYVAPKQRMQAMALQQAMAGFAGFLATIAVSPLVTYIQNSGNRFLGLPLYAQQVTSIFSFCIIVGILLYIRLVVRKLKRVNANQDTVSG